MRSKYYIKQSDFILERRNNNYSYYITDYIGSLPHIHYHVEIIYVIEGEVSVIVDGHTNSLLPGDAGIVFPHQIHYGTCAPKSRILYMIFTPDLIPALKHTLTSSIPESCFFVHDSLSELSKCSMKECVRLLSAIPDCNFKSTEIPEMPSSLPGNTLIMLSGVIQILLADFLETHPLIECMGDNNAATFKLIFDYINEHITEGLTLESTAHALGLNTYYLSRLFSHNLGITFTKYISRKKLFLAQDMVLSSDLTITEIMYATGFKSERTFYRSFKELFMTTPLQLRASSR